MVSAVQPALSGRVHVLELVLELVLVLVSVLVLVLDATETGLSIEFAFYQPG